jgi:hypothetical protein
MNSFYDRLSRVFFGWSIPRKKRIDPNLNPETMTPGEVKELLLSLFPAPKTLFHEKNQRLCSTMLEHALPLIFDVKREGPLTFSFIQDHLRLSSLIKLAFTEPQPGLRPELLKMWLKQLPGADLEGLKSGELPKVFYQAFNGATTDLNQVLTDIIEAQSKSEEYILCRG